MAELNVGSNKRKQPPNVISPVAGSQSKKWQDGKTRYGVKAFDEMKPRSLMSNNPEITCVNLAGCIQLIACDQGGTEGFIQPFVSLYFNTKENDRSKWKSVVD